MRALVLAGFLALSAGAAFAQGVVAERDPRTGGVRVRPAMAEETAELLQARREVAEAARELERAGAELRKAAKDLEAAEQLRADGARLRAEGARLRVEGARLRKEGERLRAEAATMKERCERLGRTDSTETCVWIEGDGTLEVLPDGRVRISSSL